MVVTGEISILTSVTSKLLSNVTVHSPSLRWEDREVGENGERRGQGRLWRGDSEQWGQCWRRVRPAWPQLLLWQVQVILRQHLLWWYQVQDMTTSYASLLHDLGLQQLNETCVFVTDSDCFLFSFFQESKWQVWRLRIPTVGVFPVMWLTLS